MRVKRISNIFSRISTLPPRLLMLCSFANTSLINYAFGLAAGWLLVPGDFGLLAFAQTILLIAGLLLNSGFSTTIARALVVDNSAHSRKAALVRGGLVANTGLALSLGFLVGLFYIAGPLQSGFETPLATDLVILTFPLLSFVAIVRAAAQGLERFGALAFLQVVEVVGKAIAGLLLIVAGFGVAGAIAGFLAGALIAALAGSWLMLRDFDLPLWGRIERISLQVAGGMFGGLLGLALLLNLDVLALKIFSGQDRAITGQYQAAIILANTPYYLITALLPVLFTRVSRLGNLQQSGQALSEILRLALLYVVPLELGMAFASQTVIETFFPRTYLSGASALSILALANCLVIFVAILATVFQASGNAGLPAVVLLTGNAAEVITLGLVVPTWHGQGAAMVFLMAALVDLAILAGFYLKALGNSFESWSTGNWMLKYSLTLGIGIVSGVWALSASGNLWLSGLLAGALYFSAGLWFKIISKPKFYFKICHRTVFKKG